MWQRWIRYIRNIFGFSLGEARGFSVLALGVVLFYAAWFIYRLLPLQPYNPQADRQQLDSLIAVLEARDTATTRPQELHTAAFSAEERQRFTFDPNKLSYDSLLQLGFPPYLAKRLQNYRDKGGRFRKKEDLKKLWGLEEEFYKELEPWIRVPPQAQAVAQQSKEPAASPAPDSGVSRRPATESRKTFDLNTADSIQLQTVRGIGTVLSSRIIKFREGLGGFVRAGQVREVWGLPPEAADALLERAYVAPQAKLRQLPINTASAEELARHPYISRKQAEAIVRYRLQHGAFGNPDELLRIHLLDETFIIKLTPYLSF